MGTNPRHAGFEDADARRINQEILRRIQTIPGVQSVFASSGPAVGSSVGREIELEEVSIARRHNVESAWASPGYFETLQIPLLDGRTFEERDLPDRPRVAIVNETIARQVFGSLHVVGRRFRYGGVQQSREEKVPVEIVGVVRDTSSFRFTTAPEALFYLPVAQGECGRIHDWSSHLLRRHQPRPSNATGDPECRPRVAVVPSKDHGATIGAGTVPLPAWHGAAWRPRCRCPAACGGWVVFSCPICRREAGRGDRYLHGARCAGKSSYLAHC